MISNIEQQFEGIEQSERLNRLWKKYGFAGEPPIKGGEGEKRLLEACTAYMQHILNPGALYANQRTATENSEDYFASIRAKQYGKKPMSEASRRELHNQIAIMVMGRQRSGMSDALATKIAEFASEYSYGCSLAEAESLPR